MKQRLCWAILVSIGLVFLSPGVQAAPPKKGMKTKITTPPKDRLTMAWVDFIRAHPPGTPQAYSELYDDPPTSKKALQAQLKELREDLEEAEEAVAISQLDLRRGKLMGELLTLSVSGDDYIAYAKFLRSSVSFDRSTVDYLQGIPGSVDFDGADMEDDQYEIEYKAFLKSRKDKTLRRAHQAVEIAFELGVTKHLGLIQVALIYSEEGEIEKAFEALDQAVSAGFKGFLWLKSSYEVRWIRADPRWSKWIDKHAAERAPVSEIQGKLEGDINLNDSDNTSYTLCKDGRYWGSSEGRVGSFSEKGRWRYDERGLVIVALRECFDDGDGESCVEHKKGDSERERILVKPYAVFVMTRKPNEYWNGDFFTYNPRTADVCKSKPSSN